MLNDGFAMVPLANWRQHKRGRDKRARITMKKKGPSRERAQPGWTTCRGK